jgi:hypothetical protein
VTMSEFDAAQDGSSAPSGEGPGTSSEFLIRRWEIWYVYACYLSRSIADLRDAAEKVLRAKLALAAILPNGDLGWRGRDEAAWGTLAEDDTIGTVKTGFRFPEKLATELRPTVFRLAAMRSAARNVFSVHAPLDDPSILIALPELVIYLSEDHAVPLDVTVRLFESGILIVNFRSNLESPHTSLDSFIGHYVNLALQPLAATETDRDLTFVLCDAQTSDDRSLWRRPRVLARRGLLRTRFPKTPPQTDRRPQSNHALSNRIRVPGGGKSQLSGLALDYASAVAYTLGRPRRGIAYLFLGEPWEPRLTGYWSGSPHVHLLEFSEQSSSAAENERLHETALKWILTRTPPRQDGILRAPLPSNMRVFDDFGVYINESLVLWVYTSKMGMTSGKGTADEPLSLPTHHHQVKGELLEYGRILYKSLLHELETPKVDWGRIFAIKERQVRFEIGCHDAAQFGEIRDMIAQGLKALKVDGLKPHIAALLALCESIATVTETKQLAAVGMLVACVVGVLGLPGMIEFLNNYIAPHFGPLAALKKDSLVRICILVLATLSVFAVGVSAALGFARHRRWISRPSRIQRN